MSILHHVHQRVLLVLLLIMGLAGSKVSTQTQISIDASKDNTLYESSTGALSNGLGQYFFVGRTNQGPGLSIRRGLLAFDIAGNIPAGATILTTTLTLNMSKTSAAAHAVSLHRALANWGEGTSVAGGEEGGGGAATTGDATWLHTFFSSSFWSAAGGDFSPAPSASQSVGGLGSYTWGSTSGMVGDVQQWLDNAATNFGWVIVGNEATAPTAKRFDSKDNSNPQVHPVLNITYDPPVNVREDGTGPVSFLLMQNYPNPFNPVTQIEYGIGGREFVRLTVHDILGREVAKLVDEMKEPGSYRVTLDASGLASGVYYYRLLAGPFTQTRSLMLMR
jgi:hypothetical protein